jgi:hypothetical protein
MRGACPAPLNGGLAMHILASLARKVQRVHQSC